MEIGKKIIALRKTNGMTQSDLGAKLNVTFQAVSKWERGESYPDFDTLSKMAKIFDVPISYFEDGAGSYGEYINPDNGQTTESATTDGDAQAEENTGKTERAVIGFCKECGKIVYENDEACTTPMVICKACAIRRENAKRALENERIEKQKKEAREQELKRRAAIGNALHIRNRGLIWSGVITFVWIILGIIACARTTENVVTTVVGFIVSILFTYTFVSQLFWDGIVREVALCGGKIVGMPGVIFTLDLDGFIFLIGVKILFAIIKFLIFLITLLFMVFVAYVISPFTFFPQLMKLNRGQTL